MQTAPSPLEVRMPDLPKGWHVLSYKALSGQRLAVLATDVDLIAAWKREREHGVSNVTDNMAAKAQASIWITDGDTFYPSASFPLLQTCINIDQFPDGRWLAASGPSDGKGNARILSPDGTEEKRIELGDGIEHIKIDALGRVWVGWFDDGVYGNKAWRYPGLKSPPSSYGIAAFDEDGRLLKTAAIEMIMDCYALNVFDDEAWSCTYTDFPIWQMKGDQQHLWPSTLSGPKAIAVRAPYVIATGQYEDKASQVVLLRLDADTATPLAEWRISGIAEDASDVLLLDGRGDTLHIVTGQSWLRWTVSQFVADAGC